MALHPLGDFKRLSWLSTVCTGHKSLSRACGTVKWQCQEPATSLHTREAPHLPSHPRAERQRQTEAIPEQKSRQTNRPFCQHTQLTGKEWSPLLKTTRSPSAKRPRLPILAPYRGAFCMGLPLAIQGSTPGLQPALGSRRHPTDLHASCTP